MAASSIAPVTSVSAGPPCGGLYLKPPSPGGLCDGVTTMPSAVPRPPPRLWARIACEITGVGVAPSSASSTTSTPCAASTSTIVRVAGSDSAWVSLPRNSGPSMPSRLAVAADRLGDREHVRLVERARGRDAAVAGGAERHALGRPRTGRGARRGRRRSARRRRSGRRGPAARRRGGRRSSPRTVPTQAGGLLQLADGAPQEPRDVRLRVADPLADLRLREPSRKLSCTIARSRSSSVVQQRVERGAVERRARSRPSVVAEGVERDARLAVARRRRACVERARVQRAVRGARLEHLLRRSSDAASARARRGRGLAVHARRSSSSSCVDGHRRLLQLARHPHRPAAVAEWRLIAPAMRRHGVGARTPCRASGSWPSPRLDAREARRPARGPRGGSMPDAKRRARLRAERQERVTIASRTRGSRVIRYCPHRALRIGAADPPIAVGRRPAPSVLPQRARATASRAHRLATPAPQRAWPRQGTACRGAGTLRRRSVALLRVTRARLGAMWFASMRARSTCVFVHACGERR